MAYQTVSLASLPKRKAPERTFDAEAAATILGLISEAEGQGVTDGTAYGDVKAARAAANKTKRLLAHVAPEGKVAKTALFGIDKDGNPVEITSDGKSFGFAVWLIDAPAEAEAKPASKGKGK